MYPRQVKQNAMINAIRQAAAMIPFESPTVGAIALTKMKYDMPDSEMIRGLTPAQRMRETIARTIRHSPFA
jgi:hypothetical protein